MPKPSSTHSKLTAYECAKHGPYGPSRFCCACTREQVEAERDRYQAALERLLMIGRRRNYPQMAGYITKVLGGGDPHE